MKKINKEDFNGSLIKGLLAKFVFTIAYIFVYSLLLGSSRPLAFIAQKGFINTYLILAMLVGAIPFIFCGYLIMLARNRNKDLERKNTILALSVFVISFVIYLITTVTQLVFEYRNIYDFFILLNYPLLRAVLYLDITRLHINIMMLIATVIPALFIYIGGRLRLKAITKGH